MKNYFRGEKKDISFRCSINLSSWAIPLLISWLCRRSAPRGIYLPYEIQIFIKFLCFEFKFSYFDWAKYKLLEELKEEEKLIVKTKNRMEKIGFK